MSLAPQYALGDQASPTGYNYSIQDNRGRQTYSYYESNYDGDDMIDSISETAYSYYGAGWDTASRESYYYNFDDSGLVNAISYNNDTYSYDSSDRLVSSDQYYSYESAGDSGYSYSSTEDASITYTYVGATDNRLASSVEHRSQTWTSTSNGYTSENYSEEITIYSYDYTGLKPSDIYDGHYNYTSRAAVTQYVSGYNEGDVEYSLQTRNPGGNGSSTVNVRTNSSGNIERASISIHEYASNGSSAYSYESTSDYDADGIIEYYYSTQQQYSASLDKYTSVSYSDYDEDGIINYGSMNTRASRENSLGVNQSKEVSYEYTGDRYNSAPTLSVTTSYDLDGDGVYERSSGKTFNYQLNVSMPTRHVAAVDDALL